MKTLDELKAEYEAARAAAYETLDAVLSLRVAAFGAAYVAREAYEKKLKEVKNENA